MDDFFPSMSLKPNKDCDDYHCRTQQKKFAESEVERLKNEVAQPEVKEEEEVIHEDNEWGISLVDNDDNDDQPDTVVSKDQLTPGLHLAYERRVTMEATDIKLEEAEEEESLEDLMSKMKQLAKD